MYNEHSGAERCVREITQVLAEMPNRASLIVVDDGSADGTSAILAEAALRHRSLEVVTHSANRGYGAALVTGSARAAVLGFDYALFMDSDLTNDPRDIRRFADKMREGADVIKATRYSRGGSVRGVPFYRVAISAVCNRVAHLLFRLPIYDCTNGFRAVRCCLLQELELTEHGFAIIMEELYWCSFLTRSYDELPVVLTNRSADQRPTSFAYRPSVFWRYLKYPLRAFVGIHPRGLSPYERR